jgi:hypothetical protein
MVRRRWAVSLLDAALSRVDEALLPRVSRAVARARARTARWPVRPLAMLVIVLALAVLATTVAAMLRPDASQPTGTSPVWVGVHDGDSVVAYIERSRTELGSLAATTPDRVVYALASFDAYLTPDQVAVVMAGAPGVASLTGYARVPLANRQTERVTLAATHLPADLTVAMGLVADRKDADAASYLQLAQTEPPGSLHDVYTSNADVARAEAAAYRQACGCVFALVVRGSATALSGLSTMAHVRAVDPTEIADPAEAVFAPPLPEQTDRVTPPTDAAMPETTSVGSVPSGVAGSR